MRESTSESGGEATLDGARVWLVTDGTAEAGGWSEPFAAALRTAGAASVDVLGVSGVLGLTARGLLGQGAEKVARTLRLSRRGEPDSSAFEAIERGRPDLVLVDHPSILRTLDVIRDTTRVSTVHVAVVGGIVAPDAWIGARADAYISPDQSLLDRLRRPGMAEPATQVAGPPVPAGFVRTLDRAALRTEFGFAEGDVVVLVDVAGMSAAEIDQTVFHVGLATGLRLLFHYGTDHVASDALRGAAATHALAASMFGHVDDLEEYALIADVVVAGPAAPVASYLTLDRPVIALDPALAATGPVASGAIVLAADPSMLGGLLQRIGSDGVAPTHRAAAADALGPNPTAGAAEAVARIWSERNALRASLLPIVPIGDTVGNDALAAPGAGSSGKAGRLEAIGSTAPSRAEGQVATVPLSREDAKRQLAQLILDERKVEAAIKDLAAERDRWFKRLALAEESDEADLIEIASVGARELTGRITMLNDKVVAIQAQKDAIRRRVAAGSAAAPTAAVSRSAAAEARFRQLERDSELKTLRDRAFGDDD